MGRRREKEGVWRSGSSDRPLVAESQIRFLVQMDFTSNPRHLSPSVCARSFSSLSPYPDSVSRSFPSSPSLCTWTPWQFIRWQTARTRKLNQTQFGFNRRTDGSSVGFRIISSSYSDRHRGTYTGRETDWQRNWQARSNRQRCSWTDEKIGKQRDRNANGEEDSKSERRRRRIAVSALVAYNMWWKDEWVLLIFPLIRVLNELRQRT